MRIHLVSPRNPESFWTFDRILATLGKRALLPNLALPTLAGLTPERDEVVLCDENVEAVDLDAPADVVGITGYMVHRARMFKLIEAFRRRGRLVAVGGPYATLCPEDFLGRADVLFVGEAEETWPRFLRDLRAGRWERVYRAERLPDLSEAPAPRFELLRVDRYRTMPVQFARGCPFDCEFCDITVMYGRRPRTKPVERVMAEIAALHRLGARSVFLVDDNFIGNRARAKEVLRALGAWQQQRGHPLSLMTEVSLNVARDDELLALLRAAGFGMLFIGIESPRRSSLREARKLHNAREDMLASVHKIQRYGIEVDAGMIVGFDADDARVFDEHFRFIQEARIPVSMTGLLNALPRTRLYERLASAGRLRAKTTGDQLAFTNVVPAGMTSAELYQGYRALLQRLYDHASYRRRAMALLLARGPAVKRGLSLSREDLRILLRFLRDCVVRGGPQRRRMTLRMLVETALRRPSRLRQAVSLALLHKHFFEYVEALAPQLDALAGYDPSPASRV